MKIKSMTAFPRTEKAVSALRDRIAKYESDTFSATEANLKYRIDILDAIVAELIDDADCNCDGIYISDLIESLEQQQST